MPHPQRAQGTSHSQRAQGISHTQRALKGQPAPSPGQAKRHPGYIGNNRNRPERAKASHIQCFCPFRAFFSYHLNPGCRFACPGLCAFGLSARFALGYVLLGFQPVLPWARCFWAFSPFYLGYVLLGFQPAISSNFRDISGATCGNAHARTCQRKRCC